MKDKYNESIKKMKIGDHVKEEVLKKIETKKSYHLKYSYALLLIIVLITTITCVYAEEIAKFWGGLERKTENGEIIKEVKRSAIKTNVDELILKNGPIESQYPKFTDLEKYLGVDLISLNPNYSIEHNKCSLLAPYETADNKVQSIIIEQRGILNDRKDITLIAQLITKNFPSEDLESFNWDTGYSYNSLVYVDTIKLESLGVNATIYTQSRFGDSLEDTYETYHIEFSYENIKYILLSSDFMELNSILEVLNTMQK